VTSVEYEFAGETLLVEVWEGSPDRPLVLLLHGTKGTSDDMVDPHNGPDNDYDHLSPLEPEVAIGQRAYPGIGVYSCCTLDDKLPHVRSWRDVLVSAKFPTAVYDQVDKTGPLERPVRELVEVVRALDDKYDMQLVLLAHSRGGLLVRSFLKRFPREAGSVRTVITLHSPHTGSSLATLATTVRDAIEDLRDVFGDLITQALGWLLEIADSDAYREMAIGSSFLTDLADGEGPLPDVEYFTFGGVSVRLTRIRQWVYTLDSALPKWRWPPYDHARIQTEVPVASPLADSLPNVIEELTEGRGDLLTADSRTRLSFATHQTNPINHAEALWDPTLQAQVLRILGVEIGGGERPDVPSFWG
jgi:pimeloyl-ACP methyl ester carboxylesterase